MTNQPEHAQRWIWFLDVVFGAIVALGIQKYEPVFSAAWSRGWGPMLLSLFVTVSICSFVVYDIAVYHALTKKFPYCFTTFGFIRFYLDLVMAFILYVLLVKAFRSAPDWASILGVVTCWHVAAIVWHLLAQREHNIRAGVSGAIGPHLLFIAIYWSVAWLAEILATRTLALQPAALSAFLLTVISATILGVSLYRWNQVIRKVAA